MKNVRILKLLLLSSTLVLSACGPNKKDDKPKKKDPDEPAYKQVSVRMDASLNKSKNYYTLKFDFDDSFFERDAKVYDKQLSLLSFGNSVATSYKTEGENFYTTLGFEDISARQYDGTSTKDTVGHFFAHKKVGNSDLFAVNFQGFYYGGAWTNNFIIGKTGDHAGFQTKTTEVYLELLDYIDEYKTEESVKLWINGYSRGGALSNMLAHYILRGTDIPVEQSDMFVYTFEAPAPVDANNFIAYPNVHNVINSNDLITNVPPLKYGLKRCGVDYEIYDANVSSIVAEFDDYIDIVNYQPIGVLENDTEFLNHILSEVFDKSNIDDDKSANDRNHYVDNYQTGLSNFIGYIFMLSADSRSQMLSALMSGDAMSLIQDSSGTNLKDFFKPYLILDGISFNESELLSDCAVVVKAANNLFMSILSSAYISPYFKGNLLRLVEVHYPEVEYALILNAHKKA